MKGCSCCWRKLVLSAAPDAVARSSATPLFFGDPFTVAFSFHELRHGGSLSLFSYYHIIFFSINSPSTFPPSTAAHVGRILSPSLPCVNVGLPGSIPELSKRGLHLQLTDFLRPATPTSEV
jgi:hypothetical protein